MKRFRIIDHIAILSVLITSCQNSPTRKIRLSETTSTVTRSGDQLTTTIHLEPSQQRSIAVMFFKNKTGDNNLEWLQQGLSEMFIRALSQSRHLSVLGQDRLVEIMERLEKTSQQPVDMDIAAIVAKEANVEVLLRGNIIKVGESLQLNVQLIEPYEGLILREESIEGNGLETILSMVDQLSRKIQTDLQFSLGRNESLKGIAELSTNSLASWQEYMTGDELCAQFLEADAIPHYEKAIQLDSTFVSPYLKLRQCYTNQGDREMAYAMYQMAEKLKDRATNQEQFLLEKTRISMNGNIQQLLSIQEEWIRKNPADVQALNELATTYFGLRNYDKAIEYYQKSHALDPKHKLTLNQLGYCYALTGHYDKAIAILEKYRETASDEPNPYDSLAEIYLFQGDYKNAGKYYQLAVKHNSEFIPSWNGLASTAMDAGQYKKAISYYEQALNLQADGALKSNALIHLAGLYLRTGDREKALSAYQAAQKAFFFQIQSPVQIAALYEEQGDTVSSKRVLTDFYHALKSELTTDRKRRDHFLTLGFLSLRYDIEQERSLELIDSTLMTVDNPMLLLRAEFLKTLLLVKLNRYQEVESIWHDQFQPRFMAVMQNHQNIGYGDLWQYFVLLNDLFVHIPQQGISTYQQFIASANQANLHFYEAGFHGILADLYKRTGDINAASQELMSAGMSVDSVWQVIGPFDNKDGFNQKYPPEKKIDLSRTYTQHGRTIQWRQADDGHTDGYINFKEMFDQTEWKVAYGLILIESPHEQPVQFRTGSNESIKIWLNHQEVWRLNRTQDAIIDDQITHVVLHPGKNEVLVKICNYYADWGFYFRVTDHEGNRIQNIRYLSAVNPGDEIS